MCKWVGSEGLLSRIVGLLSMKSFKIRPSVLLVRQPHETLLQFISPARMKGYGRLSRILRSEIGIRVRGFLYAEIRIMGVAGVPICIAVHSRTEVGGSWYEVCGMFLRTRMAVPPLWELGLSLRCGMKLAMVKGMSGLSQVSCKKSIPME